MYIINGNVYSSYSLNPGGRSSLTTALVSSPVGTFIVVNMFLKKLQKHLSPENQDCGSLA